MDLLLNIVASLAAAALTGYVGYRAGVALRPRYAWIYWAANAVWVLAGATMIAFGYMLPVEPLVGAGLATIAGGLTGMKYGLGRVTSIRRAE